jgi:hypothetical protein
MWSFGRFSREALLDRQDYKFPVFQENERSRKRRWHGISSLTVSRVSQRQFIRNLCPWHWLCWSEFFWIRCTQELQRWRILLFLVEYERLWSIHVMFFGIITWSNQVRVENQCRFLTWISFLEKCQRQYQPIGSYSRPLYISAIVDEKRNLSLFTESRNVYSTWLTRPSHLALANLRA